MKDYFKDTSNLISFGLALVPAILLFVFAPTKKVPYAIFAILVLLCMLSLWIAFKSRLDLHDATSLPTMVPVAFSQGRYLCSPRGILVVDSVVQFFSVSDQIETPACYGYVETIGHHGYAQIVPINSGDDKLPVALSQIIIRPLLLSKDQLYLIPSNPQEVNHE